MHYIMDNSTVIYLETRNPTANPLKNVAFSKFRYFLIMSARLRPPAPISISEASPQLLMSYVNAPQE